MVSIKSLQGNLTGLMSKINNSPMLAGIAMLLLNIGSRYIEIGLSKTQEEALRAGLARELLIFAMVYMGTKDVLLSIGMTAAFVVLSEHLLNDESNFCVIPSYMKKLRLEIDLNKDDKVTDNEIEQAITTLKKAKAQEKASNYAAFSAAVGSQYK
jgi:hypothetical protein